MANKRHDRSSIDAKASGVLFGDDGIVVEVYFTSNISRYYN